MDAFSVVLPAFNEGPALRARLERLHAYLNRLRGTYRIELIVVDDGSQDATAAVVETYRRERPGSLRFLRHDGHQGIAAAIRTALGAARMPDVVILDPDLRYPPETIEALISELHRSSAACALASPLMRGGRVRRVPLPRRLGLVSINALLSWCVRHRIATLTELTRAYDAKTLAMLLEDEPDGEFNPWILARLIAAGRIVREIPATLVWPARSGTPAGQISYLESLHRTFAMIRSALVLRALPVASLSAVGSTSAASVGTYGTL